MFDDLSSLSFDDVNIDGLDEINFEDFVPDLDSFEQFEEPDYDSFGGEMAAPEEIPVEVLTGLVEGIPADEQEKPSVNNGNINNKKGEKQKKASSEQKNNSKQSSQKKSDANKNEPKTEKKAEQKKVEPKVSESKKSGAKVIKAKEEEQKDETLNLNKKEKKVVVSSSAKAEASESVKTVNEESEAMFDEIRNTNYDAAVGSFDIGDSDAGSSKVKNVKIMQDELDSYKEAANNQPSDDRPKVKVRTTALQVDEDKDDTVIGDFEDDNVEKCVIDYGDDDEEENASATDSDSNAYEADPMSEPEFEESPVFDDTFSIDEEAIRAEQSYYREQINNVFGKPNNSSEGENNEPAKTITPVQISPRILMTIKKVGVFAAAILILLLIPLLLSNNKKKKDEPFLTGITTEQSVLTETSEVALPESTKAPKNTDIKEGNIATTALDFEDPFEVARDDAFGYIDGGTGSTRFASLDELTFYLDSELNSALSAEKQAYNSYVNGQISIDNFKSVVTEKSAHADKLNHLLISNENEYNKAGKSDEYKTLKSNLDALIVYGDTILYKVGN